MGAYLRGGRLFERGAYSITSPLGWALFRGGAYWRGGGAYSRHYGTRILKLLDEIKQSSANYLKHVVIIVLAQFLVNAANSNTQR